MLREPSVKASEAIACGSIGLRNDKIDAPWNDFHACQHCDGSNWNGLTITGAIEHAVRFKGQCVFQTEDSQEKS
jgi:hypothetical protein